MKWKLKEYWQRRKTRLKLFWFDAGTSAIEAIIVMTIIHLPLGMRMIWVLIGENRATRDELGILEIVLSNYRTADVLAFSSGLLASSTAYFFVNLRLFSVRPLTMMGLTFVPFVLVFAAAPVFLRDIDGGLAAQGFAVSYVRAIVIAVLLTWLFSIYQQKAIERVPKDDQLRTLMNNIERPE